MGRLRYTVVLWQEEGSRDPLMFGIPEENLDWSKFRAIVGDKHVRFDLGLVRQGTAYTDEKQLDQCRWTCEVEGRRIVTGCWVLGKSCGKH